MKSGMMVKSMWVGILPTETLGLHSVPLIFRAQEGLFGHGVLVTGSQGGKRPRKSRTQSPSPTSLASCPSAASFIPYHHRRGEIRAYHPSHEGTHHLPRQTRPTLESSDCEKLLDGAQPKSDALQFQTAVNVSVLQGYTEQC